MDEYYEILGIPENASENDIKKAFRKLAKQYHPDSQFARENPLEAEEYFLKIKDAYEVLSDRDRRIEYDNSRLTINGRRVLNKRQSEKAKGLYLEGINAYKNGQFEKASMLFRNTLGIDPNNPLYCSWLGMSLSKQKDFLHEAKKWCELAVTLEPSNTDFLINLALVYKEAGVKSLSMKYIHKATAIDPLNKRARFWLDKLSGKQGEPILGKIRSFLRLKNPNTDS